MDTSLPQTPGEYIEVFKKRKKLFLIPFFITAALVAGIFPLIPKVYRAAALVMVTDEQLIPVHGKRKGGPDIQQKLRNVYVEMMEPDTMIQLADMMGVGDKYRDDPKRLKRWTSKFRRNMEITEQPGGIIEFAFSSSDPSYAQKSANAVAELMVFIDRKAQQQEAEKQIRFLDQQLRIYKGKIHEGERSFVSSRVAGNVEDAMRRRTALLDQIDQFEKNTPAINRDQSPTVYKLQTELADTRSRLNQLAVSARDDSPMIRDLRKRIAELETALSREKEASSNDSIPAVPGNPGYAQALRQLREVNNEIAFLRKRQANLEMGSAYVSEDEVSAKSREQGVNEDIYQSLLQGLESAQMQLRLATFGEGGAVRVLEEAEKPMLPVWPLPWQAIGFGVFLSLAVGGASVLIREMTDTSLRGVEDAQRAFKLPILATIPDLYPVKSNLESRSADVSPQMVTLHNPQSLPAEHYRLLRTRILFVTQKRPVQVLMFSSAVAGEGKTTTSCNMAISMANELDKKIVLVDCDLRQSAVGRYLGIPDKKGLHEYLQDGASLDSILKPTRLERLSVITGGDPVANPSKLLASHRLGDLIRELRERFDYIIIDAAPVVPLADVPLLMSHVDAVALVAQVGKTPKKYVRQAIVSVENVQRAPLLGLVLTRAENTLPTYVNQYFTTGSAGRRPRT